MTAGGVGAFAFSLAGGGYAPGPFARSRFDARRYQDGALLTLGAQGVVSACAGPRWRAAHLRLSAIAPARLEPVTIAVQPLVDGRGHRLARAVVTRGGATLVEASGLFLPVLAGEEGATSRGAGHPAARMGSSAPPGRAEPPPHWERFIDVEHTTTWPADPPLFARGRVRLRWLGQVVEGVPTPSEVALVALADAVNKASGFLDIDEYTYRDVTTDLVLQRRGALDGVVDVHWDVRLGDDSMAVCTGALSDGSGPLGRVTQILLVRSAADGRPVTPATHR